MHRSPDRNAGSNLIVSSLDFKTSSLKAKNPQLATNDSTNSGENLCKIVNSPLLDSCERRKENEYFYRLNKCTDAKTDVRAFSTVGNKLHEFSYFASFTNHT